MATSIKNIIWTFFEKTYSKDTQLRFRWWFRTSVYEEEKDEAMLEIWDQSPSAINVHTLDDLARIKKLIGKDEISGTSRPAIFPFLKYAAVIALIIASSIVTYQFAKSTSNLQYIQFSVPYGACQKVILADGSSVSVNAGSILIYPTEFNADTRTVFLSGEANFSVVKNPKKPFIVQTKYLSVRALGTKFGVQAYPNSATITATLMEGSVKINMKKDKESDREASFILKPNEQLKYSSITHRFIVDHVDATKLASWEQGFLIFQGATFEQIATTLERKYNVNINYDLGKYKDRAYYVKFNPDESLDQIFSILSQLGYRFSYKIDQSRVDIYSQ